MKNEIIFLKIYVQSLDLNVKRMKKMNIKRSSIDGINKLIIIIIKMKERQLLENFQWIKEKYDFLPFPNEIKMKIMSYLYEFEMNESKIPYGIEHLVIGKFMNEIYTELLPESVKKLTIDFKKKISKKKILPKHVKEVYFGCEYEKEIHEIFFHSDVKSIIFEDLFSLENMKGNLPKNLKILKNVDLDEDMHRIPLDIEELSIRDGNDFNLSIFSKLKELNYTCDEKNMEISEEMFPENLQELSVNCDSILCKSLPKNLKKVYFKADKELKIESLPTSLEKIFIELYRFTKDSYIEFPEGVREIYLKTHDIQTEKKINIPSSVKIFKLTLLSQLSKIQFLGEELEEIYIKNVSTPIPSDIFDGLSFTKIFVNSIYDKKDLVKVFPQLENKIDIYLHFV